MTPILSYLLKANIVLVALYGFYFLCYRRDTFYGHIRWYLLATIVSAVTFPLVNISAWFANSPTAIEISQFIPSMYQYVQFVVVQSQIPLAQPTHTVDPVVARTIPVALILLWCWLPMAIFMLGKRLFQLACIARLRLRYPKIRHGNSAIIAVNRNIQPFSFFGSIFLNPQIYNNDEFDEILAHEQVHCRQAHTIDVLLVEAFLCLCWFNPIAWLLRRDVKQNLEFYADRMTLKHGFDRKHYQYSLLRTAGSAFQIANHFNFKFNHLKNRIIMLNKKESPRIFAAKYLLVVPAMAAVLLVLQISGLQAAEEYLSDKSSNINEIPVFEEIFLDIGSSTGIVYVKDIDEQPIIADLSEAPDTGESYMALVSNLNETGLTYGELEIGVRQNSYLFLLSSAGSSFFGQSVALVRGNRFRFAVKSSGAVTTQLFNRAGNLLGSTHNPETGETKEYFDFNCDFSGFYYLSVSLNPNESNASGEVTLYHLPETHNEIRQKIEGIHMPETHNEMRQRIEGIPDYRTRQGTIHEIMRVSGTVVSVSGGLPLQVIGDRRARFVNNNPLIIVDGEEMNIELNSINPQDIELITVLGTQTAMERFGERARNGVVLITTRK